MKADTHRIRELFEREGCLVVPVFQRPYVWNRTRNWEPLWDDILSMTDVFKDDPTAEPHFLGAVVLDSSEKDSADISVLQVIDGQQRLTTLQVVLCAVRDALGKAGADEKQINRLRRLVQNRDELSDAEYAPYKVWPTLRDRSPFKAIVDNAREAREADVDSRLVDAYEFFFEAAIDWLDENRADEESIKALVSVLWTGLQLVVIELTESDNAQVIFESLNDRGTPLLPSDLVKNSLFQQLERAGADVEQVFDDHWRRLETSYWQEEVRQGRLIRSRLDAFFAHFLTMRTGEEVLSSNLFNRFKGLTDDMSRTQLELLTGEIADTSDTYREIVSPSNDGAPIQLMATAEALDTSVLAPVVLYLERESDDADRREAFAYIESWLVRRALLRSTSKNYNRMLLDLLQELKTRAGVPLAPVVRDFFLASTAESGRWPDDDEIREVLIGAPLYKQLTRARLKLVLQGCADGLREATGDSAAVDGKTEVVQLMPDASSLDEVIVATLGNLTLTKTPRPRGLSAASSWPDRREVLADSTPLNEELPSDLTVVEVTERAARLADGFCIRWPHPHGTPPDVRTEQRGDKSDGSSIWDDLVGFFRGLPIGTVSRIDETTTTTAGPIFEETVAALSRNPDVGFKLRDVDGRTFVEKTGEPGTHFETAPAVPDPTSADPLQQSAPVLKSINAAPPQAAPSSSPRATLSELMRAGLITKGDRVYHEQPRRGRSYSAKIGRAGTLIIGGVEYNSPSSALSALTGSQRNGWRDWRLERTNETLAQIRERFHNGME